MVTMVSENETSEPLLASSSSSTGDRSTINLNYIEDSSSITFIMFFSVFTASFGSFLYGCVVGYSSSSQYGIKADLGLSVAEFSLFGSISTLGGMVGAALCGKLTDLIGRRGTLTVANLLFLIGWLAIASAKQAWWLDVGRLFTGFGAGFSGYAVPVYITEISPKNLRGGFASTVMLFLNCGTALMFCIGSFVTWRTLALIDACVCVLQLTGLMFIPESPRWLAKIGRDKELEATLQRLRGKDIDISEEAALIKGYTEAFEQQFQDASILDLFKWRYTHALTVAVGLMLLQQFGGIFAVSTYASQIFVTAGVSRRLGNIAMGILQITMSVVSAPLLDKTGRKPLLTASSAGMCLNAFVIAVSFVLQDHGLFKEISPVLVLIGVMGYKGSFAVGMAGIPWIILSEIFPINMKGSAGSLVSLVHWFCCGIVTYTFGFMLDWSSSGSFFIFSAICGLTLLFGAMLVPETKERTLEEIQASMTHLYKQKN